LAKRLGRIVECGELGSAEIDIKTILCGAVDDWSRGGLSLNRYYAIRASTVKRIRVIEIKKRIHIREEHVSGFQIRNIHELRAETRVGDNPRRRFGVVVMVVVVFGVVGVVVRGDHQEITERRGFDHGLGGVEEGLDGDALVATRHGVSRVDVGVACDTEGGGVGLTRDGRGGLLAHLAHPHALVARRQLVGRIQPPRPSCRSRRA
jgi:hypothetical protein